MISDETHTNTAAPSHPSEAPAVPPVRPKTSISYTRKSNPRAEHRQRQSLRATESLTMGEKFPALSALKVEVAYNDSQGGYKSGNSMKYTVNVQHAKSMFCFACPSGACIGGDFDLTEQLAAVVAARKKSVEGELKCQGWHKRNKEERVPCHVVMRFKLSLGYRRKDDAKQVGGTKAITISPR